MTERPFKRFVVEVAIEGRDSGTRCTAWAYDFAGDGCAVEWVDGPLQEGEEIVLVLDASRRVAGRLLWKTRRNGAIRFAAPLSETTIRELDLRAAETHCSRARPAPGLGRPRSRKSPRGIGN